MFYNLKYRGGILLFIKKSIKKEFLEVFMILNYRKISLMSTKINERFNTYLYFIYDPVKVAEVTDFWTKTGAILNKKVDNNKHIIIRDLNI